MVRSIFTLLVALTFIMPMSVKGQVEEGHPRLWLRADDVTRLQSWATDANPLWGQIATMTDEAVADMDAGILQNGDTGSNSYEEYPNENYAMLFAFVSLIHPDATLRSDYAERARTLLMGIIGQAAQGDADAAFRSPEFAINDRSRWHGAAFPLTVDWIYPILSIEDKALIRSVFLHWAEQNRNAYTTTNNHPEPIGVVNDPVLVADRAYARWSNNNYYLAHVRNMGMMAMALDPADDVDGALRAYLDEATGAWLYVIDDMMRTDIAGGMAAEGFEYSPQSMGYVAQFLLALYTAGESTALPQNSFDNNPYWDAAIPGYLHSLSPATVQHPYLGEVYEPAWYGSGQAYFTPDHIDMFGALGVYDSYRGNAERLNATRWIQSVTAPGGADAITDRMDFEQFTRAVLYFMLFDPATPAPTDPRPALDTTFYAPGMRRLLVRTDWTADASWFTYSNSWETIDHQSSRAGSVEFYRAGEWLTKIRVGYDFDYQTVDNTNTLAVENTQIDRDDYRLMIGERGSQWLYGASGDPGLPVITQGEGYLSAFGDMTDVYNSAYENVTDVVRVSRSVVWLMPDVLVVYDQAVTNSDGFKRFWLNLPATATTAGNTTTMISPAGQQFIIQTLLPADAAISVASVPGEISSDPAEGEMMNFRFGAATPIETTEGYFLHVLIGADAGAVSPTVELLSGDPLAPAVRVGDTTVRFSGETIFVER